MFAKPLRAGSRYILNVKRMKQTTRTSHDASVFLSMRRKLNLSERPFVFILMGMVGVCTGIMACLLKEAIAFISKLGTRFITPDVPCFELIWMPAVGVLIVVALRYFFFKGDIAHGVRVIRRDIQLHDYSLLPQFCYTPLVSVALTLGFGGSAGAEGPIAFSGAALASNVAKRFNISGRMAMIMVACGAGAGIAAIFQAPIGGALFTLEVLRMGLGSFGVMLLFVTTLIAGLTATGLQGFSLDMVMKEVASYDPHILPWAIALGFFCGFYSLYYSYIMKLVERLLDKIPDRWVKGGLSGLTVGVILMLFPSLYGEGYSVMGDILNGNFKALTFGTFLNGSQLTPELVLFVATCILVVKCFVTSLSYNGGGVTGEFAPTLFAGCFAGYVFGAACNLWLGTDLPLAQFALLGMSGVMAGAIRAPLMAMFIVTEMSSAYTLLLPLAVTATISFGIVRLFTSDSFFTRRRYRNNGLASRIKKLASQKH